MRDDFILTPDRMKKYDAKPSKRSKLKKIGKGALKIGKDLGRGIGAAGVTLAKAAEQNRYNNASLKELEEERKRLRLLNDINRLKSGKAPFYKKKPKKKKKRSRPKKVVYY